MCRYEKAMEMVREVFVDFPKEYTAKTKELRELDETRQDLLHIAEIVPMNASNGYEIANQLQKISRKRREVKDDLDKMDAIQEVYFSKKVSENTIKFAQQRLKEVNRSKTARGYRMRQLKHMQHIVDKKTFAAKA